MKVSILSVILALAINTGCTQTVSFAKYVNSFPQTNSNTALRFGIVVGEGLKMTENEALTYVYGNDSKRLYCKQKIFNMETEKVEGISNELYLPQKCMQIKAERFIIIGYTSFECQDPNKPLQQFLTLNVINATDYSVTDTLSVYAGNDFGWVKTGLFNPKNNKLFMVEQQKQKAFDARAFIYKVNDLLKFEIEKRQEGIKQISDDLESCVESLGWREAFFN